MSHRIPSTGIRRVAYLGFAVALLAGCAAGGPRFTDTSPADFWWGVWHGLISFITLIVGLFDASVKVYEVDNNGRWYDFGFLIGVTLLWGHRTVTRPRKPKITDAECAELSRKVETKLKRKIGEWAEAEPDEDWNLVEKKAEDKLKRKVREWAERP